MRNSRTFASILSEIKHRSAKLVVGKYQRPASWGRQESYHFINDAYNAMYDDDNNYGFAYLYERDKKHTDIVESQQRFLSFISSLCAYKNFIENKNLQTNEDINTILKDINEILLSQTGFPIIETSGQDNIDLEGIIENDEEYIKINKKNVIIKNYKFFYSYIRDIYKNKGVNEFISFFYDGLIKSSLSIDYCETEGEVIKSFIRFNRNTASVTCGQTIITSIYGKIKENDVYEEKEKNELINRIQPIRNDIYNDVFFARFIYYKTGERVSLTKIEEPFKNILNNQEDLKQFINELVFIWEFQNNIFNCCIQSGRYTTYELNKLNSLLKVFCSPSICEDLVEILTDLLLYNKEVIPMNDIVDIVKMLYYTHLRAGIMGPPSHTVDGFTLTAPVIRETLESKNETNTYQEILYKKLKTISTAFLKQYSDEEIIEKINRDFNFYLNKFRDSILNIINNYNNLGEIQDLFDVNNSVQREHIKPKNSFEKGDIVCNLIGNITVLLEKENAANKDKSFKDKKSSFANSNFIINKNISEHDKWEEDEIRKETDRRAKIIAEITNPLNFCKKCNCENEILETVESVSTTEAVYV